MNKKALILIDLQNDFCPGGKLAIPSGDEIIPLANQLQLEFDLVIATQDWHPHDHLSFASRHEGKNIGEIVMVNGLEQILWPDHCIQHTKGAEFHPDLDTSKIKKIFHKGIVKGVDSYSALQDNAHLRSTGLGEYLKQHDVKDVYMMGLATDYCVKYSALDAIHAGFNVHVIVDGCRGVELNEGDIEKALDEMRSAGVTLITTQSIPKVV